MIYTIVFSGQAQKVMKKWKKSNPTTFKKLAEILHELTEHPRSGLGHPEALKGGADIVWSRRITAFDRIIYEIHDITVVVDVLSIEGHYNDK